MEFTGSKEIEKDFIVKWVKSANKYMVSLYYIEPDGYKTYINYIQRIKVSDAIEYLKFDIDNFIK